LLIHAKTDSRSITGCAIFWRGLDEKWGVAILAVLSEGSLRYSELSRCLHCVSQRMLTLNLRKLERDGLIERTVTPTIRRMSSTH